MPNRSARALSSIRAAMTNPPSVSRGLRGGVLRRSRAKVCKRSLFIRDFLLFALLRLTVERVQDDLPITVHPLEDKYLAVEIQFFRAVFYIYFYLPNWMMSS